MTSHLRSTTVRASRRVRQPPAAASTAPTDRTAAGTPPPPGRRREAVRAPTHPRSHLRPAEGRQIAKHAGVFRDLATASGAGANPRASALALVDLVGRLGK